MRIAFIAVTLPWLLLAYIHPQVTTPSSQPRTVVFYLDKPTHCNKPVAFDLPSSWQTPWQSGRTIWMCE